MASLTYVVSGYRKKQCRGIAGQHLMQTRYHSCSGPVANSVVRPNNFVQIHLQSQWSVSTSPECDNIMFLTKSMPGTSGPGHRFSNFLYPHSSPNLDFFDSYLLASLIQFSSFQYILTVIIHFISNWTIPIRLLIDVWNFYIQNRDTKTDLSPTLFSFHCPHLWTLRKASVLLLPHFLSNFISNYSLQLTKMLQDALSTHQACPALRPFFHGGLCFPSYMHGLFRHFLFALT